MNNNEALNFVGEQAIGAIINGTRVEKINSEPGDVHRNGALATVVASLGPVDLEEFPDDRYAYFVEWDDIPGVPVNIREARIKPA